MRRGCGDDILNSEEEGVKMFKMKETLNPRLGCVEAREIFLGDY